MIAHVPGHLCASDVAMLLGVSVRDVYRLAHRRRWRAVRRPGCRPVYYRAADVLDTPGIRDT